MRAAFEHLTVDAFLTLPFEALAPTKALLKRFFSNEPWGAEQDQALAEAVGPGTGEWRRQLDPELILEYGWTEGRFGVRVVSTAPVQPRQEPATPPDDDALAHTFDGPVAPEATPNPRTVRFQVGPIHGGPSRWYPAAASVEDDPGAARLFREFAEVANVLVGQDFVAVSLHRPADWERLLRPVLEVVTEEFASPDAEPSAGGERVMGGPARGETPGTVPRRSGRRLTSLEQAWQDLGALRPAHAPDLERVQEAAAGDDPARRQVAASLLREADADVAAAEWSRLMADPRRSVRRATVDAMVDVEREALRPLLEAALDDADPWVRWKALRGLAELGAGPSRQAILARSDDRDFRVRLEAAAALRAADRSSKMGPEPAP